MDKPKINIVNSVEHLATAASKDIINEEELEKEDPEVEFALRAIRRNSEEYIDNSDDIGPEV